MANPTASRASLPSQFVDERLSAAECREILNELGYFLDQEPFYVTSGKVTGPKGLLMNTDGVDSVKAEHLREWLVEYQFLLKEDVDEAIRSVLGNRPPSQDA
jgi:hypothetical protein